MHCVLLSFRNERQFRAVWYELFRGIWLPLDCLNIIVLWSYKKYLVILQPDNNLAAISVWKTLQWSGSLKQSWRFKEVEYIPLPTHPSGFESSVYRISSRILFLLKPSVSPFWAHDSSYENHRNIYPMNYQRL